MSSSPSLLFVFCEGPTDVVVLKKVLVHCLQYEVDLSPFSKMNPVLGNMFISLMINHAGGDPHLGEVHGFFLPQHMLRKGDHHVFLFNGGGKDKLLAHVGTLYLEYLHSAFHENALSQSESLKVQYLFLFDADDKGLDSVQKKLSKQLGALGGEKPDYPKIPFIGKDWEPSVSKQGRTQGHIGLFLLCDSPERGTLEDLLLPIVEKHAPERFEKAGICMDEMFSWNKEKPPGLAKYKKAVITTAGQYEKPGSSLQVIIDQSPLFNKKEQEFLAAFQELVAFLKDFIDGEAVKPQASENQPV